MTFAEWRATLSQGTIIPVARSLYLCEGHIGMANQQTDLIVLFDGIRPASYPHVHSEFVVYARLTQGLGQVSFYIEVRQAATNQLVHVTSPNVLNFPTRDKLVEMVMRVQRVPFAQPERYLVELYCDHQWVADAPLELL